jgi:hypothetical protein
LWLCMYVVPKQFKDALSPIWFTLVYTHFPVQ